MAIPATAFALPQPLDPSDVDVYEATITQSGVDTDTPFPTLQAGEGVASYTLALTTEAVALGLIIDTSDGRATTITGKVVRFWLRVDPAMQGAPAFNAGVIAALELTITTNSTPSRTKQRTITVRVIQQ